MALKRVTVKSHRRNGKLIKGYSYIPTQSLAANEEKKYHARLSTRTKVPVERVTTDPNGIPAAPDMVNHPAHYGGDTTYEVIKVIEAWGLGFGDGNAVKYIARARKKGRTLEDLKKARFYLNREIDKLENSKS